LFVPTDNNIIGYYDIYILVEAGELKNMDQRQRQRRLWEQMQNLAEQSKDMFEFSQNAASYKNAWQYGSSAAPQPFAPVQPTFGRSFFAPAFTTNTTIGDFNQMVIAQHVLLYNKSGLSEPQASIAGLQTLISVGAITPNEFSQLSQISIILASNITSAEKTSRINLIDQTLKSQGASSAAIVIADAAANTKPINPVQIGLKPTLTAAHSDHHRQQLVINTV
jgi:hypothetical protein